MSDLSSGKFSRRKALSMLGAGGIILSASASRGFTNEKQPAPQNKIHRFPTTTELQSAENLQPGSFAETAGFHTPGDGGGAIYRISEQSDNHKPNGADLLPLPNNRIASLEESESVNYQMFGTAGDGKTDDGPRIKLAHQYAAARGIPIINPSGRFRIAKAFSIPISTNVHWGKTSFHIDESFNRTNAARFTILNDEPTRDISFNDSQKKSFLAKLKPGVQIIPELAPYAGCLISIADSNDRIGVRAGPYSKAGWAREELFYVETEGKIIGDIAWSFNDYTSLTATPCNDNFLTVEGGGFHFSGDIPGDKYIGYHHNGIIIERSRTIIRNQWIGLEKGKQDISLQPRHGFYVFRRVFDVTLENIRAIPWEQKRNDPEKVVKAGTYGIGGARTLNCTFRNLTAEGGHVAWGIFGTNLNKNFRVENCRLNRIDVHFHCWNLLIRDSTIGFKGISVTGGGDLIVENTERHGNHFINFRLDYGAKWDGDIRITGCRLKPLNNGEVAVIYQRMSDFDYQYPIGLARSIRIENFTIDYSAAPNSTALCRLIHTSDFSKTKHGNRLFFPHFAEFRNIDVTGREQGIRLLDFPTPGDFEVNRPGSYDGIQLHPNSRILFDNIHLEKLPPHNPETGPFHLRFGGNSEITHASENALFPQITFKNCENLSLFLGNCIASARFLQCGLNIVETPNLKGELAFSNCRIQPNVTTDDEAFWKISAELGIRFTNCTFFAPKINGNPAPDSFNKNGLIEINGSVRHHHLNSMLGNDILNHLKKTETKLTASFISKLKAHHALEE